MPATELSATIATTEIGNADVTLTVTSRTVGRNLPVSGWAKFPDGFSCGWDVMGGAVELSNARGKRFLSAKRLAAVAAVLAANEAPAPEPTPDLRTRAVALLEAQASALRALFEEAEANRDFVAGNLLRDAASKAEYAREMLS